MQAPDGTRPRGIVPRVSTDPGIGGPRRFVWRQLSSFDGDFNRFAANGQVDHGRFRCFHVNLLCGFPDADHVVTREQAFHGQSGFVLLGKSVFQLERATVQAPRQPNGLIVRKAVAVQRQSQTMLAEQGMKSLPNSIARYDKDLRIILPRLSSIGKQAEEWVVEQNRNRGFDGGNQTVVGLAADRPRPPRQVPGGGIPLRPACRGWNPQLIAPSCRRPGVQIAEVWTVASPAFIKAQELSIEA